MTDLDPTAARSTREDDALAQLIRAAGRRPSPSAEEYERVRLASHVAWQMKVHAARRWRTLWLALAAGVVVAVFGALVTWQTAPVPKVAEVAVVRGPVERFNSGARLWEPVVADAAIVAGTRLRTLDEGGAAFTMAGGVSLRAASATNFVFEGPAGLTLEGGTLYVDTGWPAQRREPIEIATPHGVVNDIGTQFEVRALTTELRVRVREGSVQLRADGAPTPYDAPAGEELLLSANGAVARRPIAADGAEWQWTQALAAPIELDGGSAFAALQWIARELGKRLVFEDANTELLARNAIMHGSSVGLEPLQVLKIVMATSAGLDYTLGDGALVIRRR